MSQLTSWIGRWMVNVGWQGKRRRADRRSAKAGGFRGQCRCQGESLEARQVFAVGIAAPLMTADASGGAAALVAGPSCLPQVATSASRQAVFASGANELQAAASPSLAPQNVIQALDLTTAFQNLRATATWPVPGTTLNAVESTFGPRIKASTQAYDWHRGIDLDAPLGSSVVATLPGTLFDVTNYTDGGLTVILKHTFPEPVLFQGKTISSFYTFYMHLDSVDPALVAADQLGQKPAVAQGAEIGKLGHSGTAIGDHLHWEVRVGTPYSLEWQLANPSSQYGATNYGFDPHVHPLLLSVPGATNTMTTAVTTKTSSTKDGKVRISTDDEQPLMNRIEVRVVARASGQELLRHTLDLNERVGFNATTNALLDQPDKARPYLAPVSFGTASTRWNTDLILPRGWVGSYTGTRYQTIVTVKDLWGRLKTVSW